MTYYEFVKNYMNVEECKNNQKYSNVGHIFCWKRKDAEGFYWFYQSDDFIIDIHDFYIKEEMIQDNVYNMPDYMTIYTTYLISANGERFNPYQTLTPNSLYTLDFDNIGDNFRFLLHENSYYLGVAIGFKKELLERHLSSLNIEYDSFFSDFMSEHTILTKSLEPIALDILNCKMTSPAAEIFFEAKANEWISLIIDTFIKRKNSKISPEDEEAINNVAKYIENHFAMNIKQDTLEKISMMSGTKLKNLFKIKFNQTITEYTQRQRINMAEMLLINTKLSIKEVAESVGYSSHSKFSIYYKRYKGKLPSEVRNLTKEGIKNNTCYQCSDQNQ